MQMHKNIKLTSIKCTSTSASSGFCGLLNHRENTDPSESEAVGRKRKKRKPGDDDFISQGRGNRPRQRSWL